jgi:hypothetical protein
VFADVAWVILRDPKPNHALRAPLKVTPAYRALVSESVERRLEQAADELDMDYALIT